ncbi:MAG: ZIP family metal transporter [Tannerellaceae bacterium]|jgi:ZIP family zinc transporter|nr:ZIP family metal transporter [Tannerellaceae bacterium]
MKTQELIMVAGGAGFIFVMTCIGSSMVFFFRKRTSPLAQTIFLGFAAGIMVAAAAFGLLVPAIEESEAAGVSGWIPAVGGFALGVLFLFAIDRLIPHLHLSSNTLEGIPTQMKRSSLLVSAVTIHNIPEGMAVGLAFVLAAQHGGDAAQYTAALALAAGIGIQNLPEGAAVALPLRQEGLSASRSFFLGCASGAVEPLSALMMVALSGIIAPYMPWLLAFAAGAMMYVVVEELIPEAHLGDHSNVGTLSVMGGFLLMMALDVALG